MAASRADLWADASDELLGLAVEVLLALETLGLGLALLGLDTGPLVRVGLGLRLTVGLGATGGGAAGRVAPLLARARPRLIKTKIIRARMTRTRRNQYVRTGSGPSGWSTPLMG